MTALHKKSQPILLNLWVMLHSRLHCKRHYLILYSVIANGCHYKYKNNISRKQNRIIKKL